MSQSSQSSRGRDYPPILTSPQRRSHGQLLHENHAAARQHAGFPPKRVEVMSGGELTISSKKSAGIMGIPGFVVYFCSQLSRVIVQKIHLQQHGSVNSARGMGKLTLYSIFQEAKSVKRHTVLPALVSLSAFPISSS